MADAPDQQRAAFDSIVRLRRSERLVPPDVRSELAAVREFIQSAVGRTIRPADAARLLGVTQPALKRWIDQGEIPALVTPSGRREIPLSELVELVVAVDEARAEGSRRPLAAVLRSRRRSAEAVDLDRVLPRKRRTHRIAEQHGLAYHRLVAERLDDHIVDEARRRVERWRDSGAVHPRWIEAWERVLAKPLQEVARAISADTPRARELRQTSPFASVLTEQERKRLARAVEERG